MEPGVVVAIAILILIVILMFYLAWRNQQAAAPAGNCSYAATMAGLWATRTALLRETITETFAHSPGLPQTLSALQSNQQSIGANFSTRYGKEAGQKYAGLLQENTTLASQIAESAHEGRDYRNERNAWYANAQEIASFLHSQNAAISQPQALGVLARYQDGFIGQINDFIAKNYPGALEQYRNMATRAQELSALISSAKKN